MFEKEKISAFQMALMIYPTILTTAILVVPAITGKYAERDMWISPILGSLNGFFTAFILYQLHKIYPKESIIQYSRHIIGPILGKILGFIYLFFFLHTCGIVLREYATFISISFLQKTPPTSVIVGSMVLVCAFAVRGGLEVLGRSAQVFVPIFIFLIPMTLILLLKDLDVKNMFPIMEHGLMPPILGAAAPQAWFSEVFFISMMLPFLTDREKGLKWSMISILTVMFSLTSLNLLAVFLFGGTAVSYNFPIFTAIKYISLASFFEHLEAISIVIWILGAFIKISVFYYALVLGTTQWLNLSDYRPLVFSLGFLLVLCSTWGLFNMQQMTKWLATIYPFYGTFLLTLIPMVLLLIAMFRKGILNRGG